MVVTIIDDMISTENVTIQPGTHEIVYRKINLQRGKCRRLKQVDVFDFTKTDDKMIVGSNIIDVPNEFDIFKRE